MKVRLGRKWIVLGVILLCVLTIAVIYLSSQLSLQREKNQGLLSEIELLSKIETDTTLVPFEEPAFDYDYDDQSQTGELNAPIEKPEDPTDVLFRTLDNSLIPYEGVLGGTMGFWRDDFLILNDRWAYAYFEDGHIGGYLLLEYTVVDDQVSWKVINQVLE